VPIADSSRDAGQCGAPDRAGRHGTVLALCLLFIVACIAWIEPLYRLPLHIDYNYNEGWNAYFATRAAQGMEIYAQTNGLVWANYPPVSFYVLSLFRPWVTDYVVAGRLLAGIAYLSVGLGLVMIGARLCRSWTVGGLMAAFFLTGMGVHYRMYVAMNDPQMLAHAFMVSGVAVYVWRANAGTVILAAALIVIGGFTKHTLLGVPLAMTVYVAAFDRPRLWLWIGALALFSAAGFWLCYSLFGPDFFTQIFATRTYSLKDLIQKCSEWFSVWSLPLAALVVAWAALPTDRGIFLGVALALASSIVAVPLSGGAGVFYSVMFDVLIGLSIGVGAVVARVRTLAGPSTRSAVIAFVLPLAMSLCLLLPAPASLARALNHVFGNEWLARYAAAGVEDTDYLRDRSGPAFCEKLAICYWAGKAFEIDHFNAHQAVLIGKLDAAVVHDKIRGRHYQVIQLSHFDEPQDAQLYTQAFLDLLAANYRLDRRSLNGVFFRPRDD
jgi:hypothetical protein